MSTSDFEALRTQLAELGFRYEEVPVEELRSGGQRMRCVARAADGTTFDAYWFRGNEGADEPRLTVLCEVQAYVLRRVRAALRGEGSTALDEILSIFGCDGTSMDRGTR